MERPYVICHILSSLDGKITGPFMGTEAAGALGAEYGRYRTEMNARALLYGTTTTKEFTGFRKPVLEEAEEVPEGDFVADDRADLYFVSVDVDGEIGWESGIFCNKGRAPAHVIEVLTASTPAAYKACLRKTGVSYIIAGEKELDCEAAMKKLYQLFHIEKLLICGEVS
ncbi:5-amino-6-(5-phosphoribosylamino)uracil reductase [Lachnospiraceae bacterium 54-11]